MAIVGGGGRLSITTRLMIVGGLMAGILWLALDMINSAWIESLVRDSTREELRNDAETGRVRFRQNLNTMFSIAGMAANSVPVER
ncbi:MAG: hypothetical protein AB7G62_15795, partial [Magnetospirillum sp.]